MRTPAAGNALETEVVPEQSLPVTQPVAPPKLARAVLRSAEGRLGVALGAVMLLIIVFGRFVAPYDPSELATGPSTATPSIEHPMGTDQLGRDIFSRFLEGGSSVLVVPLVAVTLAMLLGAGLGMLAAYRGGTLDQLIVRLFDLMMALPPLLIVLVFIAGIDASWLVIVLTVAIVFTPRIGRVIRGTAHGVVTQNYVAAAQLRGETTSRILTWEILPNIAGQSLVTYALYLTYGIVFIATLSFLGLGAQPPSSDWGLMVAEARTFFTVNPWGSLLPALGIAALSVAFTLIADAAHRHLSRGIDAGGSAV